MTVLVESVDYIAVIPYFVSGYKIFDPFTDKEMEPTAIQLGTLVTVKIRAVIF